MIQRYIPRQKWGGCKGMLFVCYNLTTFSNTGDDDDDHDDNDDNDYDHDHYYHYAPPPPPPVYEIISQNIFNFTKDDRPHDWLHGRPHDQLHDWTHDRLYDRPHHDRHHYWQYDYSKIVISGQFCTLIYFGGWTEFTEHV